MRPGKIVTLQRNKSALYSLKDGLARVGVDKSHHLWIQSDQGAVYMPGLQTSSTADKSSTDPDWPYQTLSISPSQLIKGASVRCSFAGTFSATVATSLLFQLTFVYSSGGSVSMSWQPDDFGVVSGTGTNIPFSGQCVCTVRSVGTSGTARGAFALNSQGTTGIITQVAIADQDTSLGITFDSTITSSLKFVVAGGINRSFTISSIIIELLSP